MYRFVVIGAMPTPSKKMKKNDPSYKRVGSSRYPVSRSSIYPIGAGATILIDTAKGLCAQNHRLYRQMKMYRVKVELVLGFPTTNANLRQKVQLFTAPDTWYLKKSMELAFAAREEQLANSTRGRGRWDDFRVGWDSTLKEGTIPIDGGTNQLTLDEYQLSKAHDATDSTDHEFVLFGAARDATNNLYGVIEQYDQIGNTMTNQPLGAPSVDAYSQLHPDAGLIEAAGDLRALQGDNPPYDADSFNGADARGSTMMPTLFANEINSSMRLSTTFDAPLGLIKVVNGSVDTNGGIATSVRVTVLPGNYKGVRADDF